MVSMPLPSPAPQKKKKNEVNPSQRLALPCYSVDFMSSQSPNGVVLQYCTGIVQPFVGQ